METSPSSATCAEVVSAAGTVICLAVPRLAFMCILKVLGHFPQNPRSRSTKIAENAWGDFGLRISSLVFHVKSATDCNRDCAHVCSRSYFCACRRFLSIFRKTPVSGSNKIAEDRCSDFGLRTSLLVFHVKSATGCDRDCAHVCSRSYLCACRRFLSIFRKTPVSGSNKIAEDRCGDFGFWTSLLVFHVMSATGYQGIHRGTPAWSHPVALFTWKTSKDVRKPESPQRSSAILVDLDTGILRKMPLNLKNAHKCKARTVVNTSQPPSR